MYKNIIYILLIFSCFSVCVNANWYDLIARRLKGTRRSKQYDLFNTTNDEEIKQVNVMSLIESHGYPHEAHEVLTEDGYILTVHRIPRGPNNTLNENVTRPAVLLHHGVMASSACFVLRGPDKDLAYLLVQNGYDVWLSNCRGNAYSRKHVSLDPDRDKTFWRYSFHEIGYYDLPATIDYILNATGQSSLFYMGHSMGGGVIFITLSLRTEYNSKIKLMLGLAPATYIVHRPSQITKIMINNGQKLITALSSQGYYEIFPLRQAYGGIGSIICHEESPISPLCSAMLFLVVGVDEQQLEEALIPKLFYHFPAGSSLFQFTHFLQCLITGGFRQMDFGERGNLQKYNQTTPPDYDLSKVTAPVALYYGDGDFIITREDVKMLESKLSNVIGTFRVPFPNFNHLDFLWAEKGRSLLYNQILTIMKKYK